MRARRAGAPKRGGAEKVAGVMSGFTTNYPGLSCLTQEGLLCVFTIAGHPDQKIRRRQRRDHRRLHERSLRLGHLELGLSRGLSDP
jgi:hypothetical protein